MIDDTVTISDPREMQNDGDPIKAEALRPLASLPSEPAGLRRPSFSEIIRDPAEDERDREMALLLLDNIAQQHPGVPRDILQAMVDSEWQKVIDWMCAMGVRRVTLVSLLWSAILPALTATQPQRNQAL